MKKSFCISTLSILVFITVQAQTKVPKEKVFIRVYDVNYSKMGKGNLLYGSDSTIIIIRRGRQDTFSVKEVFYIKTKRSAGHSVLMGTGIGVGVGLTVITVGVFVVSGGGDIFYGVEDDHSTQQFAALMSPVIGAAIGGLVGAARKSETFEIKGDIEKWQSARKKLLNIQN